MPVGNYINKRGNIRTWAQSGGPGPANTNKFAGVDTTWWSISGVTRPFLGGIKPMFLWAANQVGSYVNAAIMTDPPALPTFKTDYLEKKGGIPYSHIDLTCPQNFYELVGECKSMADFLGGWEQYVRVYPEARATSVDDGDRAAFSEDSELKSSVNWTCPRPIYTVGSLTFGPLVPGALVATPLEHAIYAPNITCANCGIPNDGTKIIYAVAKGGAAAKPISYYSLDGGATWTTLSIAAAANAEDITKLVVVGNYLFALSPTASSATQGGYYYSPIDPNTGVLGTWVKVLTGFLNNKQPRDAVAVGNVIWICGDGGYIYKVTDVTAGATVSNAGATVTTNLTDIHATDTVIVAVGAANGIVYSDTQGANWAAPANVVTGTLQAISVVNRNTWWVGTSTGTVFYTQNGGATAWVQKVISSFALAAVTDIIHASPEVMYIGGATATPVGVVVTSWDGGNTFTNATPRIKGMPTFTGITKLAAPFGAPPTTAVNNLLISGTGVLVADGYLVLGVSNIV
jgi:hypothetical protein